MLHSAKLISPRCVALTLALAIAPFAAPAQPYGIDTRDPNTGVLINNLPPAAGSYTTQALFPASSFTSPVHITNAGDGTNRVFVVERAGRIRVYDADDAGTPAISTFLNITTQVQSGGSEQGLLSVAFHPDYATNGRFFVFYTRLSDSNHIVSEYINSNIAGNPPATPTERILLSVPDFASNHNGGQLQFGHDGYLYIGIGDGGSGDDPQDNGQRMTSFLGKILRIDVDSPFDSGKQYHVPLDNPLIEAGGATTNVYVESRQPGGALSSIAQGYMEINDFVDSALKSTASGLSGTGSRLSTNTTLSATARFTPTIVTPGLYNVYVTTTNNASANAANTTYRIVCDGEDRTFRIALTSGNTGNQWRLVRRNVPMAAGTQNFLEITETATQSGSMFADAARFERVSGVLPEIYTYGMRNPWRFSPDRVTGEFWIGDVGQNNVEEVDLMRAGGNYGWRDVEGNICTPGVSSTCDLTGYDDPVHTYGHSGAVSGCSITGGYVYRGAAIPSLYGRYLYADYCSGWVRGFLWDGTSISDDRLIASPGLNITSFGEMENGELLFVANGNVRRFVESGSPPVSDLPVKLSDNAALYTISTGGQVPGLIPHEPREQFWTDGAIKTRHMAIPGVQQATYQPTGGWDFPNGTTLVKNYSLPLTDGDSGSAMRVETRLLVKNAGDWRGFSYRWNEAETEAFLLTSASTRDFTIQTVGGPLSYTWQFPSSSQCLECHTTAANRTLGLQTVQMNCDFTYPTSGVTDNQLRTLDHISLFNPALPGAPGTLASMPGSTNLSATLEQRVKSYLQANCAHCHMPGGPSGTNPDMRWETILASMNIIDEIPARGDLGVAGARIVKPGAPDESVLLLRMESLDPAVRMPPLSTTREDEAATALVREWINSLASSSTENWMLY